MVIIFFHSLLPCLSSNEYNAAAKHFAMLAGCLCLATTRSIIAGRGGCPWERKTSEFQPISNVSLEAEHNTCVRHLSRWCTMLNTSHSTLRKIFLAKRFRTPERRHPDRRRHNFTELNLRKHAGDNAVLSNFFYNPVR